MQPMSDAQARNFLGLRTVVYHVADLEAAKAWYSDVLGQGPYFDEPFYAGFSVGGFELGLLPIEDSMSELGSGRSIAYWGVSNIAQSWSRLLGQGASAHSDIQDVGGGIKVAAVNDPFGNVFGIIENPHFKIDDPST